MEGSPLFPDIVEILIIEPCLNFLLIFVVEGALAVETTIFPLSAVVRFVGGIVEATVTVHFILFPLALIINSVRVDQGSLSVFFAI